MVITGKTISGYNVTFIRKTGEIRYGDPEFEARVERRWANGTVEDLGWCRYSWRLAAVLIGDKWHVMD